MPSTDDNRGARLRELDGWRAVSVILVVLHHVGWFQHPRLRERFQGLGHVLYYCGPLGVKIFFVISGFVICRLLISEERQYGSISLKGFYYRRIFRILPPLIIYLAAVSLLLSVGMIRESWRAVLNAALFLNDVNAGPHSWFVGHTWSLGVEEHFYLLFPAMWMLTPKPHRGRVFVGVCLLCAVWYLSMIYTGWNAFVYNDTRAGFLCIACGVLLAIYETRARAMASAVPIVLVALAGLVLLAHPVGEYTWKAATYEVIVPPGIGLILLFSLEKGALLRAFLCCKPVQAVGLTSYGIYLWQQPFTAPWYYFIGPRAVIPQLFPLLALLVPLSYMLIERPAMRFGKTLSRQSTTRSVPVALAYTVRQ